jgi:hypothetical protein
MSFIGGLFSGGQGVSWEPERVGTAEQAQQLYNQQQDRLKQQQEFTQALMNMGPQAMANQQMISRQLAAASKGLGPSVAQTQLNEATAANAKRQAAMMQSQRGASANLGLMSRNIADVESQTQQDAARQGATLRAQEMLAARQQLAGMAGQQIGQIGEAQQIGMAGVTSAQQNILNAIAEANRAKAGVAGATATGQSNLLGGLLGGGATALKGKAEGGMIEESDKPDEDNFAQRFATSFSEQMLKRNEPENLAFQGAKTAGTALGSTIKSLFAPAAPQQQFSKGGTVPAMVSPGEKYLPPSEVKKVAQGQKEPIYAGETIPGQAKVKGDSYANDTVPKNLEKGGIVIPRSVMQSEDPAEQARRFVAAVLAKKQAKRK